MDGHTFVQYRLEVQSSGFKYLITNELGEVLNKPTRYVVICDEKVVQSAREIFSQVSDFIVIEVNEKVKTLDGAGKILLELAQRGVVRGDILIAVGGGALQDLVTLTASIYMRGLEWIYAPTTLMSMLDSCIGGKSSINLGKYKNLLGNIYPPTGVYINKGFVSTLSRVDIACGLAEGVKICFAASVTESSRFEEIVANWRSTSNDDFLEEAIFLSLEKKRWFVEIDEFDKKERKLLNFGHSFGHALEAATGFALPHGMGVFIGMHTAINFAGSPLHSGSLLTWIEKEVSIVKGQIETLNILKETFISAMKQDKKNSSTEQCLILPNENSVLVEKFSPLSEVNLEKCFDTLVKSLNKLEMTYEVL
jgi:3-dehydroquinate synthase